MGAGGLWYHCDSSHHCPCHPTHAHSLDVFITEPTYVLSTHGLNRCIHTNFMEFNFPESHDHGNTKCANFPCALL